MKINVVVDVGNTRIKWGLCSNRAVRTIARVAHDDPDGWDQQAREWLLPGSALWAVSGVQPERRDAFIAWLRKRGDRVCLLDDYRQLPLLVRVPSPERVGIDRLLNGVAARYWTTGFGPVVIVDVGTAVTVDLLDSNGDFCGGTILPGFQLMARALHEHTALLPLVDIGQPNPPLPGTDTTSAIRGGIYWAVAAGVHALIRQLPARTHETGRVEVILTGGGAPLLVPVLEETVRHLPEITLEGIRLAAESLPESPQS